MNDVAISKTFSFCTHFSRQKRGYPHSIFVPGLLQFSEKTVAEILNFRTGLHRNDKEPQQTSISEFILKF
jgi:hypothetical protein